MLPPTPTLRPRIEVRLPELPDSNDAVARHLIKNTYEKGSASKPTALVQSRNGSRLQHAVAQQQRLAEHVFYPPEAVAQGLQGEVRLLLRLDAGGKLVSASVVTSSGHEVLDKAAVSAAYATGVFPGAAGELLLPVDFRLSE